MRHLDMRPFCKFLTASGVLIAAFQYTAFSGTASEERVVGRRSTTSGLSLQGPLPKGFRAFAETDPWNWDVSEYDKHPLSDDYVAALQALSSKEEGVRVQADFGRKSMDGIPIGIPINFADPKHDPVIVNFDSVKGGWPKESDHWRYPIPPKPKIEKRGGGRHLIVVDVNRMLLYELAGANKYGNEWRARSGAVFDLVSMNQRPDNWTSADGAGLPIFPGLVRYKEAVSKEGIRHALRCTVGKTSAHHLFPATHDAGVDHKDCARVDDKGCGKECAGVDDTAFLPMGARLRLRKDFKLSGKHASYKPSVKIVEAMKRYGLFVSDNGSEDHVFLTGVPSQQWDNTKLRALREIKLTDLEVVVTVREDGRPIYPQRKRGKR